MRLPAELQRLFAERRKWVATLATDAAALLDAGLLHGTVRDVTVAALLILGHGYVVHQVKNKPIPPKP